MSKSGLRAEDDEFRPSSSESDVDSSPVAEKFTDLCERKLESAKV